MFAFFRSNSLCAQEIEREIFLYEAENLLSVRQNSMHSQKGEQETVSYKMLLSLPLFPPSPSPPSYLFSSFLSLFLSGLELLFRALVCHSTQI